MRPVSREKNQIKRIEIKENAANDQSDRPRVLSVATVRRMVDRHEIAAVQLGGHSVRPWRISASALNAKLLGWEARG